MRWLILITFFLSFSTFTEARQFNRHKKRVIDVDSHDANPKKKWMTFYNSERKNIRRLISILKESTTGKKLLKRAKEKASEEGRTVISLFRAGEGSLLDSTLVRRFSKINPDKIYYKNKSTIYINKRHTTLNAVLDLAHELTHYTFRKPFNPYVGNFTVDQFIKSTVEGLGGEVDAYLVECKVLYELYPTQAPTLSNCEKVKDPRTGKFSKRVGVTQFYKVGQHVRPYAKELEYFKIKPQNFPYLSSSTATFISSAWGLPYPLAALLEYKTIMDKVCHNDQKRLVIMQENVSRSPASVSGRSAEERRFEAFNRDYISRCEPFI